MAGAPILGPDGQPLMNNFGEPVYGPEPAPTAPGFTPKTADLSSGPVEMGKTIYNNATRGFGPAGLVSEDGTAAGVIPGAAGVMGGRKWGQDVAAAAGPKNAAEEILERGKIDPDPGGGGDRSETDDENARILHELDLQRFGGSPKGPGVYFQPEGSSKAGIGGPELYDEAFRAAPARREQAMRELGVVQEDRAKELAGMYDRQALQDQQAARAMQVRQEQDQAEIARRQEELGKATKYYSRELQDSGKFWANPGNIVAAISYSLMPIFSNDPTVGVKLINQAVQQDLDNRTRAADMATSGMRANLDGYRKIAGDRQAGDLLARAESHRMAAQEIARVGAKFGGPEANKQMAIAIEDQKTRAAAAEMEFYAKYVHTAPKKTVPQETAALYRGPGGWAPLGQTGPASQSEGAASPVNSTIKGSPSQVAPGGFKSPVVQALARTGGPAAVDKLLAGPHGAKVSDADTEQAVKMFMMQKAARANPANPALAYDKLMKDEMDSIAPVTTELQKTAGTRHLIAQVRGTMDTIARTEAGDGRDPEQFLSWARTAWPKSWVLEYEKFSAKDPRMAGSNAEAAKMFREQKAKELRAALQGVFNQHTHELFGGAQSTQELGKAMMEVGEKSTFHQTQMFLDQRSQELQKQATELKAGLTPMQRILLRTRTDAGASDSFLPRKEVPKPKGPTK
jgi:hypothetical protein